MTDSTNALPGRMRTWLTRFVAIACCGAALAALAAPSDPPGRVGRVSHLGGNVSFYADQEEGWQPARLNFPVTSQNSLWTEPGGRAEFRVGSTALRLDTDSVLDVQVLNDEQTIVFLQRGTANVRIGVFEPREIYRVLTPDGQVTLRARGSYRIESDPDRNETRVTAFQGRARIEAGPASANADAGRTVVLRRNGDRPSVVFEHVARTEFDDWAQTRDESWDAAAAAEVSPQMTGYEDLNTYGSWIEESDYGRVWVPRNVSDDWAPYRYGSWRYVRPWGWTWVDDAPWGFAPFHYGRWVQVRGRWGWWPGNRIYRPVYSPALVAWVGEPGWNVTFSSGSGPGIGWFPLAPYEAFVPWYTSNTVYIHNINYIYGNRPVVVRPPSRYANIKPGVTVIPTTAFHTGAPAWRNRGRLSGEAAASMPVVQNGSLLPPRASPISGAAAVNPRGNQPVRPGVAPSPGPGAAPSPVVGARPSQDAAQPGGSRQSPVSRGEPSKGPTPLPSPLQGSPKPNAPVVPFGSMPSAPAPSPNASPLSGAQPGPAQPRPNYSVPADAGQPKPLPQRSRSPGERIERSPGEQSAPRGAEGARREPVPQYQTRPGVVPQPAPANVVPREARPVTPRPDVRQPEVRQPEAASVPRAPRPAPPPQETVPRVVEKPQPPAERERERQPERPGRNQNVN